MNGVKNNFLITLYYFAAFICQGDRVTYEILAKSSQPKGGERFLYSELVLLGSG